MLLALFLPPLTDVPQATIIEAYWQSQLPAEARSIDGMQHGDVFIELKHQGDGPFYIPMRKVMDDTDRGFVLHPTKGPDLHLTADEGTFSWTSSDDGGVDRTFVRLILRGEDRGKLRHRAEYKLVPTNGHPRHVWRSNGPIRVWVP